MTIRRRLSLQLAGANLHFAVRVAVVVLFVTGFGWMLLGQGVTAAAASSAPPIDSPEFDTQLQQLIDGKVFGPSSNGGQLTIPGENWFRYYKAGQLIGRYPMVLEAFTTAAAMATAFDIGWKIGRVIDNKWLHLSGDLGAPPPNGADFSGAPKINAAPTGVVSSTVLPGPGVYLSWSGMADTACGTSGSLTGWRNFGYWPTVSGSPSNTCVAELVAMESVASSEGYIAVPINGGDYCRSSSTGDPDSCAVLYKSEDDLESSLIHSAPQDYSSQTANVTTTMPSTSCTAALPCSPPVTASDSSLRTAAASIEADPTATSWANCTLDPTNYACPGYNAPPGTQVAPAFVLPEPDQGMSYSDYEKELREKGYLGTIVLLDQDMSAAPSGSDMAVLVPGSVTGVHVLPSGSQSDAGNLNVYDPTTGKYGLVWPATAPLVQPGTTPEIDVEKVPSTYDPTANGGDGSGGPSSGGGVDFTPITGLTLGCKFPFGLFCYAQDVMTKWFTTVPQAPEFKIQLPSVTVAGHTYSGGGTYDVSLSYLDTYMSWIRDMLAAVLGIGVSYWIAGKLLGFDVGDANAYAEGLHDHTGFTSGDS